MAVSRRKHGDVSILDVEGEFYGGAETDKLERAIQHEVEAGTSRLLLNLYSCRMMNSMTLSVMIRAKKTFDSMGRQIRLCGLNHRGMKSLIVTVRLMEWFDVSDSERDAVAAFEKSSASA
jgi:anti-anti-sigma factor